MKIWYSYGSEHSMNLVMIGRFKNVSDAKKTKQLIDRLTEELGDKIDVESFRGQYSDDVFKVLRETNSYVLNSYDFECFRSEKTINVEGKKIIIKINRMDAATFFKLMIEGEAKVEIFSAHDNPALNGYIKMIGQFKTADDAKKTKQLIDRLTEELGDKIDVESFRERYSDDMRRVLRETNCYILSPYELSHFLYDNTIRLEKDKIVLRTDEVEVAAFFKLMIDKGAKIEVFSAHDYPEEK